MGFKVDEITIEFKDKRHMHTSFAVGRGDVQEIKVLDNGVEIVEKTNDRNIPAVFYPMDVIFKLTYFVDL